VIDVANRASTSPTTPALRARPGFEIADKTDDPSRVTLKLVKEDGKERPKAREVTIAFTDDDTFTIKDPFARDPTKAATLVFKRAAASGG
jgi:hypothetical protein